MKKVMCVLSLVILVIVVLFVIYLKNDDSKYENVFSIKSSYSFINNTESFNVKLYSSKEESLLLYGKEATVVLHDIDDKNVINCNVLNVNINDKVFYNDKYYYEYVYNLSVNISSLCLKECYLNIKFKNIEYDFFVGYFEIIEKEFHGELIGLNNLFGLTHDDFGKSLCAIVLSIKNKAEEVMKIREVMIGSNYQISLTDEYVVESYDSNDIYDYIPLYNKKMNQKNKEILIKNNENKTLILPIKYIKDYYLSNTFLLLKINDKIYYIPNFTFIESNDLLVMKEYISTGMIYEF